MNDVLIREKEITKTSLVGIITNVILSRFKAIVGIISGSISIVLDSVNNLTDALSSIITIVGIKLAKRKPDDEHPFGYGRIEYFSAIIISGIVFSAGIMSLKEAVGKVFHPESPDYSIATLIVIASAVVVKLVLGRYVKKQGEKFSSDALIASGSDASFDAVISASTLLSAAAALLFHISIDGIVAAVIALFIIKAGFEMLTDSLGNIIGNRPDSEITKDIKRTIRSIDGVIGAYDLILHDYGPDSAIGSVHIEISSDMDATQLHKLTKKIQLTIYQQYHIMLTVGIYAVREEYLPLKKSITDIAMAHQGVLGVHGLFVNEEDKYVSFDVLTDFTAIDRPQLRVQITDEITSRLLPEYTIDLSFDTNYTT